MRYNTYEKIEITRYGERENGVMELDAREERVKRERGVKKVTRTVKTTRTRGRGD